MMELADRMKMIIHIHSTTQDPVIDRNRKVIGMVTSGDLNKLLVRR